MTLYRRRDPAVEARHWPGGADTAGPIIDWILSRGGTARWSEARLEALTPFRPDDLNVLEKPEHIAINDTRYGTHEARPGDWIVEEAPGEFHPMIPALFHGMYEQVE
jgi:hypothetical protein